MSGILISIVNAKYNKHRQCCTYYQNGKQPWATIFKTCTHSGFDRYLTLTPPPQCNTIWHRISNASVIVNWTGPNSWVHKVHPQKFRKSHWCVPFTATFSKRRKIGALWSERCDVLWAIMNHKVFETWILHKCWDYHANDVRAISYVNTCNCTIGRSPILRNLLMVIWLM